MIVTVAMLVEYLSRYDANLPVMWSGEQWRTPGHLPEGGKYKRAERVPVFLDRAMAKLSKGEQ
jgi:hypothetical protein